MPGNIFTLNKATLTREHFFDYLGKKIRQYFDKVFSCRNIFVYPPILNRFTITIVKSNLVRYYGTPRSGPDLQRLSCVTLYIGRQK